MSAAIPRRLQSRSLTAVLSFSLDDSLNSLDRVSMKQSVGMCHGDESQRKMWTE